MRVIVLSLLFVLLSSGCTAPVMRNIRSDASVEPRTSPAVPRPCRVVVAPIRDDRPDEETTRLRQTRPNHFVPAVVWWQGGFAGPIYANPRYYDDDLLGNMRHLMQRTLDSSDLYADHGPTYRLESKLDHYYGVGYNKEFFIISTGGGVTEHEFFPTGHVALKIRLIDEATDEVVASRYVSEAVLFSPEALGSSLQHTAYGMSDAALMDNKTLVATLALRKLMTQMPMLVDQMLAEESAARVDVPPSIEHFTVIRVTDEYDFVEELVIEFETGRILQDRIVPRDHPLVSSAREWVVLPVSENGHWLSAEQYIDFVDCLSRRYRVEFTDNLSAATFMGALSPEERSRKEAASVVTRPGGEPPRAPAEPPVEQQSPAEEPEREKPREAAVEEPSSDRPVTVAAAVPAVPVVEEGSAREDTEGMDEAIDLFEEACGDGASRSVSETHWRTMIGMGYTSEQITRVARELPDDCEHISLKGAILAMARQMSVEPGEDTPE